MSTNQIKSHRSILPLPFASSPGIITFSLTGGGLAWIFHFLTSSVLSEWGAVVELDSRSFLGINFIAWAVIVATGLSLAASLWALRESIRMFGHYRQLVARQKSVESNEAKGARLESSTRASLMAVGVCSNCVFVVVILAQALPVFFYWGAR